MSRGLKGLLHGDWEPIQYTPLEIPFRDTELVAVSAGRDHTLAMDAKGYTFAWGATKGTQDGTSAEGSWVPELVRLDLQRSTA